MFAYSRAATFLAFAANAVMMAQPAAATILAVAPNAIVLAHTLAPTLATLHQIISVRTSQRRRNSNANNDAGSCGRQDYKRNLALSPFMYADPSPAALSARIVVAIVRAPLLVVGTRSHFLAVACTHFAHGVLKSISTIRRTAKSSPLWLYPRKHPIAFMSI